jgi:hypothetical protein
VGKPARVHREGRSRDGPRFVRAKEDHAFADLFWLDEPLDRCFSTNGVRTYDGHTVFPRARVHAGVDERRIKRSSVNLFSSLDGLWLSFSLTLMPRERAHLAKFREIDRANVYGQVPLLLMT